MDDWLERLEGVILCCFGGYWKFGKFGKFGVETAVEFRGSFESQPVIQDTEQAQLLQRSFWASWDLRSLRPWQSDKMDFCMIYV